MSLDAGNVRASIYEPNSVAAVYTMVYSF